MQRFSQCLILLLASYVCPLLGLSATPLTFTTTPTVATIAASGTALHASNEEQQDADDLIARRIIVTGDVQGGYYRSCVLNEAGRFRRLVGTMTPPDYDTKRAEIYVEGKRKMVEGFVRWCQKGNVGLSQMTAVEEVVEEDPTGLYEGFYIQTH